MSESRDMKRKDRVIFDTNIWVSFLISKALKDIDKLIFDDKILLLFSDELMTEFLDVTSREKFTPFFSKEDNFLLSLAKDGKADYLITGDKDLLVIEKFEKTMIVNLISFLERYKQCQSTQQNINHLLVYIFVDFVSHKINPG